MDCSNRNGLSNFPIALAFACLGRCCRAPWSHFSFMNAAYFHVPNLGITVQPYSSIYTPSAQVHIIFVQCLRFNLVHIAFYLFFSVCYYRCHCCCYCCSILLSSADFHPCSPASLATPIEFEFGVLHLYTILLRFVRFFLSLIVIICCASRYSPTFSRIPFIEQPNQYRYFIRIVVFYVLATLCIIQSIHVKTCNKPTLRNGSNTNSGRTKSEQ